jgi:ankyrin repeat protein
MDQASIPHKARCALPKLPRFTAKKPEAERARMTEDRQRRLDGMLLKAAENGHAKRIGRLLKAGAQTGAKDNAGWTPLIWAAFYGYADICKMLICNGVDIEARDREFGTTPLMRAALKGRTAACRLLLESGADIGARDKTGMAALHYAARNGHAKTCAFLLNRGADIEARNEIGWMALHHAAWMGHARACTLLIEKGADIGAKTDNGKTAAAIDSFYKGKPKTAAFLRSIEGMQESMGRDGIMSFLSGFHECVG